MIWLIVGAIFLLAVTWFVLPLWRHAEHPLPAGLDGDLDEPGQERLDEKKRLLANLRALRLDFAEGKLAEKDFYSLEAEYEQQLVALLEPVRQTGTVMKQVEPRQDLHRMGSVVLTLLLAAVTFPLFIHYWRPAPVAMPQTAQGTPDVSAMVARLEQKIATNPKDIAGLLMLARSYATLNRHEEAAGLWRRVLELDDGSREARGGLAISLLQSGGEQVAREALHHLAWLREAEPDEPAWLWYQGVGLSKLGRQEEAREALRKILALIPPGSENARIVQDALRQLGG